MNKIKGLIKAAFFMMAVLFIIQIIPQTSLAETTTLTHYDRVQGYFKMKVTGTNAVVTGFNPNTNVCSCTIPTTFTMDNITYTVIGIERNAFKGHVELNTVTIQDTIVNIGDYAFMGCSNLTTVNMPARMNSIGQSAFSDCHSLTNITIPEGITVLPYYLFSDCHSLTSVDLPDSLAAINNYAFSGCSSLSNIELPHGVTNIYTGAFIRCTALRSIAIPSGVTRIYDRVFQNCSSLIDVTLPEGVISIEDAAFDHCSSLAQIRLPNSLQRMGIQVFSYCRSLNNVTLPGNLTKVSNGTFKGCSSLTSLFIPSSITDFGNSVFEGCSSLKSFAFPDTVIRTDGIMFRDCTSLESVKFSARTSQIGSYYFHNCTSLRTITIPEHITFLGDHAFDGCTNLTEANFLGDAPYVNDFGVYVFDNCAANFKIKYIFGKSGWSNPFHGYPAECVIELNSDIPDASIPIDIDPNALGKIPDGITANLLTLKAQAGVGFVKLDWNSIIDSRGVSGYNVYRSTSSGTQPNTPVASNNYTDITYIDSNVETGITYYYIVKPVFADNSIGTASNEAAAAPREAAGTIQLTIDNPIMSGNGVLKEIDSGYGTVPVIKDGSTFLPIRALVTEMGGNIDWDGTQKKVTIDFDGITVELWIGQTKARVDGTETIMTALPFVSANGRTMLPLRFVGESLGCDVSWDNITRSVTIDYDTAAVKTPSVTDTAVVPSALLPAGVPSRIPAPSISNLQCLKDDSGVPYFRLEVTIPDAVRTLDQVRPADGWVDLESLKIVDDEEEIADGGGLEVFMEAPVPGKSGVYYITFEVLDEGGLSETLINERKYTFKTRFSYAYGVKDGYEYVYSPWSNELSGQSESYYNYE